MKLLLRVSFSATLKTLIRNRVSPPNVNTYNRGFAAARKGLVPDPDDERTYNELVLAYCRDERVDEALGILRSMTDEKGEDPNLKSFNAVAQGLCGKGMVEEAANVVEEMNRKGLTPDWNTYLPLIHLFCNMGKVDKAHKLWNEMIQNRVYLPVEKLFEMKKDMVENGMFPDARMYRWLMSLLCDQRRLSEAFDLFPEMLRRGVSPNKETYDVFKHAYCLQGEFSKAFHLQDEMIHKGCLPDFVTGFSPSLVAYTALIHGYCFLGRVDEALEIFRGMAEMGLSPDYGCYNTLISGFCQIGDLAKAYKLKVEMYDKQIGYLHEYIRKSLMKHILKNEDSFSSLMNYYLAQGNLDEVFDLESEMSEFGSLPSNVYCSVFLNGLIKKARTIEVKEHLVSFISNHCLFMPAFVIYDSLIENCSNNEFKTVVGLVKDFRMRGLVNEAARAHDTMLEGNYKPDGVVYNLLIFDHCRLGNVHKAYDMYMEMVHYGFAPHMFSVLALIQALCRGGRYTEMSWVVQNTLRSCNLNDCKLLKVLNGINTSTYEIEYLQLVLAEMAMDGMLLDGGTTINLEWVLWDYI